MISKKYEGKMIQSSTINIFIIKVAMGAFLFSLPGFSCNAQEIIWQSLVFEKKGTLSQVVATVEVMPGKEAVKTVFQQFQPALSNYIDISPDYENLICMHVTTSVTGLFIPDIKYERAIWFNTHTLQAVFRLRWNANHPKIIKFYTWKNSGVMRLKLEYDRVSRSLHEIKKRFYSWDSPPHICTVVSEPAVLLYLVSHPAFSRFDRKRQVCVFGKKELHALTMTKKEIQHARDLPCISSDKYIIQDINDKTGRAEHTRCAEADTLFLISEINQDQHAEKKEKFSLMGLQDEISMEVNTNEGLPVRIKGVNEYAGTVVLELKRVITR